MRKRQCVEMEGNFRCVSLMGWLMSFCLKWYSFKCQTNDAVTDSDADTDAGSGLVLLMLKLEGVSIIRRFIHTTLWHFIISKIILFALKQKLKQQKPTSVISLDTPNLTSVCHLPFKCKKEGLSRAIVSLDIQENFKHLNIFCLFSKIFLPQFSEHI